MAFSKVNSHHTVSVMLNNIGTSTQVDDDKHRNLVKDFDNSEDKEEAHHNGVQGITQGGKLSSDLDMEEALPQNGVWGVMQGNELSSDYKGRSSDDDSELKCFFFVPDIS